MLLQTKQIDPTSLGLFVANYLTGAVLSGMLQAYFAASGWAGGTVLAVTGNSPQTVNGPVTFAVSPNVPYSGTTGSAPSARFVTDSIATASNNLSGYINPNVVLTSGAQIITGIKTFVNSPQVPPPVGSGSAVNQWYVDHINLTGAQGPTGYWAWQGNYNPNANYAPGTSVFLSGSSYGLTGISGFYSSGINPALLTGGWTYVAQAGGIGSLVIQSGAYITGNFVNLSFFVDPVLTGLDLADAWISRTFQFTGFALGCLTSGNGPYVPGAILSGHIYCRDLNNIKTTLQSFTLNTGVYTSISGGFGIPVTGMYRMGIDLTSTISGISKLAIGAFGFGLG